MLVNVNTIFCENIYQLNDGRYFAAGILPGRIVLPPDAVIPSFAFDILMQFESDTAGQIPTDIRLVDVKGVTVAQHTVPFDFPTTDDMVTVALSKAIVGNAGSGMLRVHYRTAEQNWTECGTLRVIAPLVPSAAQVKQ